MKQKFFVRTINKKGIRLSPIPFFEAVMAEKSVSKSIKSLSCAPFSVLSVVLSGDFDAVFFYLLYGAALDEKDIVGDIHKGLVVVGVGVEGVDVSLGIALAEHFNLVVAVTEAL